MIALALAAAAALGAAPANYRVRIETSRGPMVIAVVRADAPRAADRFYSLVESGYYDDTRFFRVIKDRWAQFGINGSPSVAKRWRATPIPDEDRALRRTNARGTLAFAFAEGGLRSTQVFINLRDNPQLDAQGFAPFGRVVEGMDVADALYADYGETSGGGIRAGKQEPLFQGGNAWLDAHFPRLDRLLRARIVR